MLFLSSSEELLKTSAPKFVFSQDGISVEARLASSFPGSGDGAPLPTSRQAAMELTVCGSGPRACVPVSLEAEYLSAPDTPAPTGAQQALRAPGLRVELPSWGWGLGNTAA